MKKITIAGRGLVCCGVFILALSFSARPASAECNGRCLIDQFGRPYCSLSFFGTVLCVEEQDFCAEFACPYGALPVGRDVLAKCSTQALPAVQQIEVVELKARS